MKRTYQVAVEGHGIISTMTTEEEYTHAVVRIESDGRIVRPREYFGSKALADKKARSYKRFTGEVRVVEVKDVTELLDKAYNLGAQAFRDGKKAIPALDENFMNEIFRGMKPGEESPCYVKSWLRGWMEVGLKGGASDVQRMGSAKQRRRRYISGGHVRMPGSVRAGRDRYGEEADAFAPLEAVDGRPQFRKERGRLRDVVK